MKNYIDSSSRFIKEFLIADIANRYLVFFSVLFAFVDYIIWHLKLSSPDLYVYVRFNIYPVKFLAIILLINFVLALFSFRKEKEISYLLSIGNIIIALLIIILEIFYLTQ